MTTRHASNSCLGLVILLVAVVPVFLNDAAAADRDSAPTPDVSAVLSSTQLERLDRAVDRGLSFLSKHQLSDGSFESQSQAQPAVTSFCVMAFLSRGHVPGEGPYGDRISRAIDFVLSTQQPGGLLCNLPGGTEQWKLHGSYNHAIAGVMLGEVYGMTSGSQQESVHRGISRALEFTRREQMKAKRWPDDRGGWRYLLPSSNIDADMSLTSWHLMFYRSAHNAGFDIPEQAIAPAVAYIRRCFDTNEKSFAYGLRGYGRHTFSRGMAGAGIVSLSLAGEHHSDMAREAAQFVLRHPFTSFNSGGLTREDRYYYAAYYCSQAMFQLGEEYWAQFYPGLLRTLVANQDRDGSWAREANQDGVLGLNYSTSLAILALTPPYQILPIYQR